MQNIKIPQNVQIEDKLVGPFSLKQLLLVACGGGFSYALYASISKSVGYVPATVHTFIWLPALLSAAFALVRINDLSLLRCCLLVMEMMSKPRRRAFLPRQGLVINIQTRSSGKKLAEGEEASEKKGKEIAIEAQKNAPNIGELTRLLDQRDRSVTATVLKHNVDSVRSRVTSP